VTHVPRHGDRLSTRLSWIGWRERLCAEAAALATAATAMQTRALERLPPDLSAYSPERPGCARVTVEGPSR
jgi:hypothetical protein